MSKSAVSVFAAGIYLAITGIGFLIIPNLVLSAFQLPPTNEVWIRILGMVTLFLGFYYISAARNESRDFFYATLYARTACFFILLVLVLSNMAYPILMVFGVLDVIGAVWTFITLKKSATPVVLEAQ